MLLSKTRTAMKSDTFCAPLALRYLARKLQRVSTKIAILVFRLFQILQTRSMPSSKLHLISVSRGSGYFNSELLDLRESAIFPRMRKVRDSTLQQLPKNGLPEGTPRVLKRALNVTKNKHLRKTGYLELGDFCTKVLAIEAPDILAVARLNNRDPCLEFGSYPLGVFWNGLYVVYTVS